MLIAQMSIEQMEIKIVPPNDLKCHPRPAPLFNKRYTPVLMICKEKILTLTSY